MALLKRYACILPMLVLLLSGLPAHSIADTGLQLQESAIKAGLLYNFLKYVEWPSGETSPTVTVCVFDGDSFGAYLQSMTGRTVNQRSIAIRVLHDIHDASGCQLLFVSGEAKDHWPQILKALGGKDVLTVGDFPDFARSGGMIEFGRKDDHINVQLNMDSVTGAQLHVEDRLLKLVTVVHSGE